MRPRVFAILCVALLAPSITQGEALYLKDGSTIHGTLVRVVADTLYFKTSFGAEVHVARDMVLRLDFVDQPSIPASSPAAEPVPFENALPGTVMVKFDGVKVSSRVVVYRGKDEEALLQANAIECAFYVGADKSYSVVDSVTENEIREGPETTFKNEMIPKNFKVAVPPGSHRVRIVLSNVVHEESRKAAFVGEPLDKRLLVEDVQVLPGRITQLMVGMKRKMKIGSPQLVLIE